ncbi:transthyretin [Thelephora ganbajun]|uniref:Transthyretin n=1 Tax=Thelephora ganbajun TaxID=370292 RepID=A0ACB6Z751_THEGA|nr:transthyretin [Thelephora ganbajun]
MASKSPITCHVLDSSIGKPAQGVKVKLLAPNVQEPNPTHAGAWIAIGTSVTNADGRCLDLLPPDSAGSSYAFQPGIYQIVFETKEYFERTDRKSFYPFVQITFTIENPSEHYHVPLLISPFSYTTYRGS